MGFFLSRSLSCFHLRLKHKGWRSDISPHLKHHRWVSVWVSRHSFFVNLQRQVWLSAKWVTESGGQDQALFCSKLTCAFSKVYNAQKRDVKVAVERNFVFSEGAAPDPCSRQRSHTGGDGKVTVKMQQVTDQWFPSLTRHSKCNFHTLS